VEKTLSLTKWIDKTEQLEMVIKAADVPRLTANMNPAILLMIRRLMNDSNYNVVLLTIKLCRYLAQGLRKQFAKDAKQIFMLVIHKLKDKKTTVVEESQKALESFFLCIQLEDVEDKVKECLLEKNS